MNPVFRRAGRADAEAIRDLTRAAYARWVPVIGREPLPMTADYAQAVYDHRIDLLEEGGCLVALIEMLARPDHLFLVNLAIAPERQGQGLGRVLLERAQATADDLGLPRLELGTNEAFAANLRFYASHGFAIVEEKPFRGGVMLRMARPAPGERA